MDGRVIAEEITLLQRMLGLAGLALVRGKHIIYSFTPFAEQRTQAIVDVFARMLDGYRQVGRQTKRLMLRFDGGTFLLVTHKDHSVILIMSMHADAELMTSSALILLNDYQAYFELNGQDLHFYSSTPPPAEPVHLPVSQATGPMKRY
jgi:hypothetical protein